MASPLSPLQNATVNRLSTPQTDKKQNYGAYEVLHVSSVTTTTTVNEESSRPETVTTCLEQNAAAAATTTERLLGTMDATNSSSPFVNSVATTPGAVMAGDGEHKSHNNINNINNQENGSPKPGAAPFATPKPVTSAVATATKPARPGSRILSGSELSPLKILQGRVTGPPPPPSSSAASTTTGGSPASPDSGAESRREGSADDQTSSTASSPPPAFPPQRTPSFSSTQTLHLPPSLRTSRKITSPDKRFPVKISVPLTASTPATAAAATATTSATSATSTTAPVALAGPRSPQQQQSPLRAQPQSLSPTAQPVQAFFAHIQEQHKPAHGRQLSLDEAIQLNEGLKQAIEIFEDDGSATEDGVGSGSEDGGSGRRRSAQSQQQQQQQARRRQHQRQSSSSNPENFFLARDEDLPSADDTMVSTFSTFSALPNATMFSKVGGNMNSPNKHAVSNGATPRAVPGVDVSSARTPRAIGNGMHGGPLPNRTAHYDSGNTTNLLMDFTEQLRFAHSQQQSPSKGRLAPSHASSSSPDLGGTGGAAAAAAAAATPQRKSLVNLLDFEIPPLPTPRSIPTVTPRELESLKSNFLSEISSLKASLSGKEAEVLALKTAVGDAEKRVGECMEQLREERGTHDHLAEERDQWERRGREMEEVLRKVKGEIVLGQRDREELEAKLDESEKRREMVEMMAQEAETKMAAMRAGRATAEAESNRNRNSPGGGSAASTSNPTALQREVEIAVERVARELHAAYKAKHETKVAALKKSYEARWEKRVRELEAAVATLAEENEKLRIGRDATLAKMVPGEEERRAEEQRREREARDAAQIKELGAEVDKLEAMVRTVKADNGELRTLLEQERVEKGELVILAEEMMSMQQSFLAATPAAKPTASAHTAPSDSPRKSRTTTPGRTSISSATVPSGIQTANRNSVQAGGGSGSTTTTTTTTTPGRSRPMSMHGTGRVSGLKPPSSSTMPTGGAPSRIGRLGHDRKLSNTGGGIPRPGSGLGVRSGLMSSIEKMGSYRGRGE
ncbi:hypothetical protein SPI_00310 [Niveomyces insectorum RCEF 264]|uniref:Uncharacterized protein n=1 Tax=Niveomyces insectorum RCEF 264 TaxID=1081102 RepID=A0A168A0Y3_9HYPO|nr:hypothetical protein SPI_00310 [Niveomyces insectorum RCEF 264]